MKLGEIITVERENIAKGKYVVGVLRPNDKWGKTCKEKVPHIPAPMSNEKTRQMYNLLGSSIFKKGGVYVLFDWYDIEFWDDEIIISGGYIHTGNPEEGFRQIMPYEYCKLNTVIARKTIKTMVSEENEESGLGEDLFGEELAFQLDGGVGTIEGEDPTGLSTNNYTVGKSLKRFLILSKLGFECTENGVYSAHKIYYHLINFLASKNLLLLSSISAMQIADDKWYTYCAIDNLRKLWYERKERGKEWMYAYNYPEPYYLPYTILGSDAIKNPELLDKIEKKVSDKFRENTQWQENPMVFVVKPRRGSLGVGITFHKTKKECLADLNSRKMDPQYYIVQEYILLKNKDGKSHDYRILVSGDKMVWAYERIAKDNETLTANRSTGGSGKTLNDEEMKGLEEISKVVIRHLLSANLRFSNLYKMISDYKRENPTYKEDAEIKEVAGELWGKFKVLYKSAWEFFGYDVSPSYWDGKKQYVLIEINTSPGVQGPYEFGKLGEFMERVAESLLEYCEGYGVSTVSSPFYNVNNFSPIKQKEEESKTNRDIPTIVILIDYFTKKKVENPLDRIERWDVVGYLQTSHKIDYARVVVTHVYNLYVKDSNLFVNRGIIKDNNGPNKFVEQNINLPVDYLIRKQYKGSIRLSKRSHAYQSLIKAGVEDSNTTWGFGINITRWFEEKGGPTLVTPPVSRVGSSKVATELAFRDYKKTKGINVRRPKTFLCGSSDKIIECVMKLKASGFKLAVIKPSRGFGGHGIYFLNVTEDKKELISKIKKDLPWQIRRELKTARVLVQGVVGNLHLINGRKTNLRTIITPVVRDNQVVRAYHVFSWDRLSKKKYSDDPNNIDAQKPLDDVDKNDKSEQGANYPYLKEYIEKGLVDQGIIQRIEYETLHALRAIFKRAGEKWGGNLALDMAPFDIILVEENGEVVPLIIEVNSQGAVFRGLENRSDRDEHIRKKLSEVTFGVIASRALEFKHKR